VRIRLRLKTAIIASGKSQRRIGAEADPPIRKNRLSEIVQAWAKPTLQEMESLSRVLGDPDKDALFDVVETTSYTRNTIESTIGAIAY